MGGSLLADLPTRNPPKHILDAYQLAYPNLAAEVTFTERVAELDGH